jgi:hypothetical protein
MASMKKSKILPFFKHFTHARLLQLKQHDFSKFIRIYAACKITVDAMEVMATSDKLILDGIETNKPQILADTEEMWEGTLFIPQYNPNCAVERLVDHVKLEVDEEGRRL